VRAGDTVVVDDPTYPGAMAAYTQAGATIVGVGMDSGGVQVDAVRRRLAAKPALLYLQSTLNSPTGTILSLRRRSDIARLVADSRVPLVEDLALADLGWRATPPPIAALIPNASVAVVGSLSKLFWGGLRVGFLRAPEPLALRLARIKATHDLGSSVPSQVLADRLLRSPSVAALTQRRVADLRAGYDVLADALHRQLPKWSWAKPSGGLSLWVKIPDRSSEAFAQQALRFGVAVATPRALSPSHDHGDHLRLSFSGPHDELREGVSRLAAAWNA
jgi:DNA-binding transcriptional MocR family regulator